MDCSSQALHWGPSWTHTLTLDTEHLIRYTSFILNTFMLKSHVTSLFPLKVDQILRFHISQGGVEVILQDYSGLSCDLWLEILHELFPVIINEPQHSLGQYGITGLQKLPWTAPIVFGKETFHFYIDIVQIKIEIECLGF